MKFLFLQVQGHVHIRVEAVDDVVGVLSNAPGAALDGDAEIVILVQQRVRGQKGDEPRTPGRRRSQVQKDVGKVGVLKSVADVCFG